MRRALGRCIIVRSKVLLRLSKVQVDSPVRVRVFLLCVDANRLKRLPVPNSQLAIARLDHKGLANGLAVSFREIYSVEGQKFEETLLVNKTSFLHVKLDQEAPQLLLVAVGLDHGLAFLGLQLD